MAEGVYVGGNDPEIGIGELFEESLEHDNKDEFVSLLPKLLEQTLISDWFDIFPLICENDAAKCWTALLEGETCLEVDDDEWLWSGLHFAARWGALDMIKLLLNQGAKNGIGCDGENQGLLPLSIALARVRKERAHNTWYPGHSVFKLIIILCLPQMRRTLDICKLLAESTKEVEEVAYGIAKDGKVTLFAILLMVAREKVLGSSMFQSFDPSSLGGSKTIRDCIEEEIASLYVDESELARGKVESENEERMLAMRYMQQLLLIFERAGNAIDEYLQSQNSCALKGQVVDDISLKLKQLGFVLNREDTDISDICCQNELLNYIIANGTCPDQYNFTLKPPPPRIPRSIFRTSLKPHGFVARGLSSHANQNLDPIPTWMSRIASMVKRHMGIGPKYTLDVEVSNRTKAIVERFPKFPLMEKWAFFALAIKRGITRA